MTTNFNMAERTNTAVAIFDGFAELFDRMTTAAAYQSSQQGTLFVFTRTAIKTLYYTWKMKGFLQEGQELVALLKATDNYMDRHELLCAFNDMLTANKELLIAFLTFTDFYPDETGEDLYNIFAYGGEV